METHSCMNVTLFNHDCGRRDGEERRGDHPGRHGTCAGDVTGKREERCSGGSPRPCVWGGEKCGNRMELTGGVFPQSAANWAELFYKRATIN